MSSMIGFLIFEFAIVSFFVFTLGFEFTMKEKILIILGFTLFIALLEIGLYLMGIR